MNLKKVRNFFAAPEYAPRLRCSPRWLAVVAVVCVIVCILLETLALPSQSQTFEEEIQAAQKAELAMRAIRDLRLEQGIALDPVLDPNLTGLIGFDYSDLTTTEGNLIAKRTATNPAFAGLMVKLMREAGLKRGDKVAVNMSGSFPSLNIALLAACETVGVEPYMISSVGASTYGANIPGLTWLDMEKHLYEKGIFPYRSMAVSLGGVVELHGGLDGQALELGYAAIERHGAPFIEEGDYTTVEEGVNRRKVLFDAQGPIKAFINVGGGLNSLGWVPEAARLDTGLIRDVPKTMDPKRGLIFRYAEEGMPVIHVLNVVRLAESYALPVDPIPLPQAVEMSETRYWTRYVIFLCVLFGWFVLSMVFLFFVDRKQYHTLVNKNEGKI